MSESKLRAEEIEKAKNEALARHQAQQLHGKLMSHAAVFAPSFYLADAAGMVRLIMHEPAENGEPVVRGAFIITPESALKLAEILPKFVIAMSDARKQAQDSPVRASTVEPGLQSVDHPGASVGAAAMQPGPSSPVN